MFLQNLFALWNCIFTHYENAKTEDSEGMAEQSTKNDIKIITNIKINI